jgi:hypothetical protein
VQVTAKLAALSIQAFQQPDQLLALSMVGDALNSWLTKALAAMRASPGSRAAAAVRQQLQESQVLQHLGPAMEAAAARVTAALEAIAAASSGSSGGRSSAAVSCTMQDSIQERVSRYEQADKHCGVLLKAFQQTSNDFVRAGVLRL